MGALRNAVKRKTHKERSQPLGRRRFGLLEKKKDYQLRAKDFHKKEETLQGLRRKAEERNPDEFYFGMQSAKTKDGVHVKESAQANKYTQEELRLMKTQDIKYVALKAQTEAKKVEKLQQRLHILGGPVQSRHTVFVDNESDLKTFSAAKHFDTPEELLSRTYNRPREEQLQQTEAAPALHDDRQEAKLNRAKASSYKELAERTSRHKSLQTLAQKMALRKELMGKGTKKKLPPSKPGGKPVYKWRLERK